MKLEYLIPPWKHQEKAIEWSKEIRDLALLFEPGTGKTSTTINIIRHKYIQYGRFLRTLVLCPVVVCENWKREFAAHSKVGHRVVVLKGSQKKRLQIFETEKDRKPGTIFVTNFEALQMKELLQKLMQWQPEILVTDESQRLKNPQATRTKMAILLADLALHRYILSGTPILNSPMDIWAQFRILDRGETFQDSLGNPLNFHAFRNRYFIDQNAKMPSHVHFPKFEVAEGTLAALNEKIYQKAMRVLKHECLDLPPFIRQGVGVELAPEQARLYLEMKREFITYLQDKACVAQIAVTKALRLQQIVSGYLKTECGEEITLKNNPRLEALEDLLEDLTPGAKVIVWSVFHQNYAQIASVCKKLKVEYVELHGGTKEKDRQLNIDRFQTDPLCRVLIGNPGSGGIGVNLTAASESIVYSRDFSLNNDLQSEARNYRGGSEIHEKIRRTDIVARETIDEVILQALASKLNLAEQILSLRTKL